MAEHTHAVLVNFGIVQRVNSREANLQPFMGSDFTGGKWWEMNNAKQWSRDSLKSTPQCHIWWLSLPWLWSCTTVSDSLSTTVWTEIRNKEITIKHKFKIINSVICFDPWDEHQAGGQNKPKQGYMSPYGSKISLLTSMLTISVFLNTFRD